MRSRVWIASVFVVAAVVGARPADGTELFLAPAEKSSVALLNDSRSARRLAPLVGQPGLDAMARAQAARMAARGEIYHNPNLASDADRAGLPWSRIGENVGVGPNVSVIHEAFLDSPQHRDNMLYPAFNAIGVGVATGTGSRAGLVFVAHVFGQLRSATPRLPSATAPPPRVSPRVRVVPVPIPIPAPRTAEPMARVLPSANPNAVVGGVVDRSAMVPASA